MNVSVGEHWEVFINNLVKGGRYGSASEVVRDALRLVEEREARLSSLRDSIRAAIDEDVWYTQDEVDEMLQQSLDEWEQRQLEQK